MGQMAKPAQRQDARLHATMAEGILSSAEAVQGPGQASDDETPGKHGHWQA